MLIIAEEMEQEHLVMRGHGGIVHEALDLDLAKKGFLPLPRPRPSPTELALVLVAGAAVPTAGSQPRRVSDVVMDA